MHCYMNKVLTLQLLQEGANSSASCQDRGEKQAKQPRKLFPNTVHCINHITLKRRKVT